MNPIQAATIENIICEYIIHREESLLYGRKRIDAEKEYNKLLVKYTGDSKQYTLDHANNIYKAYLDMLTFGEASTEAEARFIATEEKLKEIGRILFEATITAEIFLPPTNGEAPRKSSVTVSYINGQVMVNQA